MAIGPLGNIIYINQNMNVVASKATDQLNRFEVQNFMAAEALKEKDKTVTEVRPTEEAHGIDPDRDKNQPQEEKDKEEKAKEEEEEESQLHSDTPAIHILDIKV